MYNMSSFVNNNNSLVNRFQIELKKNDHSGIYACTQGLLAYNSNKIEGSTLTQEQTATLFLERVLEPNPDFYRSKDVEEMSGHFLMFSRMIRTLDKPLTEDLIKSFHYELKAGVFEDRANGYAIGDYKKRANIVGSQETVAPSKVHEKMSELLDWYHAQNFTLGVLAEFHAKYERIHPFQDGNGRTGRLLVFRECLENNVIPVLIPDSFRIQYITALKNAKDSNYEDLISVLEEGQDFYKKQLDYFGIVDIK